ncbi:MAG: hypothetical protein CMJ95_10805 [Planctomycetes bacterium]|nr:hypothetical protein [Planctomycetota bacterium]
MKYYNSGNLNSWKWMSRHRPASTIEYSWHRIGKIGFKEDKVSVCVAQLAKMLERHGLYRYQADRLKLVSKAMDARAPKSGKPITTYIRYTV